MKSSLVAVSVAIVVAGLVTAMKDRAALQEALGFVRVAHFRETGRKFGRWLDVVYLQKML